LVAPIGAAIGGSAGAIVVALRQWSGSRRLFEEWPATRADWVSSASDQCPDSHADRRTLGPPSRVAERRAGAPGAAACSMDGQAGFRRRLDCL